MGDFAVVVDAAGGGSAAAAHARKKSESANESAAFNAANSRIFLVGAGGIGCEILKNLVISGFRRIDVIDLDTIEVSNLNRQFLFRREHVGQPKAIVACEAAKKLIASATNKLTANNAGSADPETIVAHHDTIFSSAYGVSFVKKFDLVINALDNLKARSHMNRLCLAANVPLVETGSRGWVGQTYLILRGQTECFDCITKKGDRTFAGCTIRNTPSEPIHCIVWAKFLFNQLFGEHDPDQDVSPDDADPELKTMTNGNGIIQGGTDQHAANDDDRKKVTARQLAENSSYDFAVLFNKFFNTDITTLCSMSKLWAPGRGRRQPQPLQYDELSNIANPTGLLHATPSSSSSAAAHERRERSIALDDERLWSPHECADVFEQALKALFARIHTIKSEKLKQAGRAGVVLNPATEGGGLPLLVWDKDDNDAMDFLAAAANLRMLSFHIPMQTRFRIKSMAGRIIPAVAATNAVVAALAMRHVWQVLKERAPMHATAYLTTQRDYMGHKRILGAQHARPNPNCLICSMASGERQLSLKLNPQFCTVAVLEDEILKKELRFAAPDCHFTERGVVLISSEPGETEAIRNRTLAAMGVSDGSLLVVDDFLQEMKIQIVVLADPNISDPNLFYIIREGEQQAKETAADEREMERAASPPKRMKISHGNNAENGEKMEVSKNSEFTAGLLVPSKAAAAVNVSPVPGKRKIDEVLAAKINAKMTTTTILNSRMPSGRGRGGGGGGDATILPQNGDNNGHNNNASDEVDSNAGAGKRMRGMPPVVVDDEDDIIVE